MVEIKIDDVHKKRKNKILRRNFGNPLRPNIAKNYYHSLILQIYDFIDEI